MKKTKITAVEALTNLAFGRIVGYGDSLTGDDLYYKVDKRGNVLLAYDDPNDEYAEGTLPDIDNINAKNFWLVD